MTTLKNIELQYYDSETVWSEEPMQYQLNILEDIKKNITHDIESILDVGCGNGLITNRLPENIRVVGVDWSEVALKYVKRDKHKCDITKLPYADDEFDIVMANDVIEHLAEDDKTAVLNEITRVAKKKIILTIPIEERYCNQKTTCLMCGHSYHINLHKATYNIYHAMHLLPEQTDWFPSKVFFTGIEHPQTHLATESLRQQFSFSRRGGVEKCPHCTSPYSVDFGDTHRELNIPLGPLTQRALAKICPRTEILVVFSKEKARQGTFLSLNSEKAQDIAKFEVNKGLPCFKLAEENHEQLSISFIHNFAEFLLPRFKTMDTCNIIEIPEWFILQVHSAHLEDFLSYKDFDNQLEKLLSFDKLLSKI